MPPDPACNCVHYQRIQCKNGKRRGRIAVGEMISVMVAPQKTQNMPNHGPPNGLVRLVDAVRDNDEPLPPPPMDDQDLETYAEYTNVDRVFGDEEVDKYDGEPLPLNSVRSEVEVRQLSFFLTRSSETCHASSIPPFGK